MIGRNIFEFLDPKDHQHVIGDMQKVLKTGILRNIEHSFLRKNVTRFSGEVSISLTLDAEGKPKGFIKVLRDITKRKQAEEMLQRSEELAGSLGQENAVMAEIGQVISSTLNIEEVYERFAAEARKLIPFDRIAVTLNNHEEGTATVTYASGVELEERRIADVFPLSHSGHEQIMRTRASLLI